MSEDAPRRSSRSAANRSVDRRSDALEKIRNARKDGTRYRADVSNMVTDVYDYVTEEEFDRRRGANEPFVENDDGLGYYDDGTLDFDEEEDDQPTSSRKKQEDAKLDKKKKKADKNKGIGRFLVEPNIKSKIDDRAHVNLDDDADLLACMQQMDQINETESSANQWISDFGVHPLADDHAPAQTADFDYTDFAEFESNTSPEPNFENSFKRLAEPLTTDEEPVQKRPKLAEVLASPPSNSVDVQVDSSNDANKAAKEIQPAATNGEKLDKNFAEFCAEMKFGETEEPIEELDSKLCEDVVRMYWIETFEDVYNRPGTVFLYGIVNGKSCCVVAQNIEQLLYFIPKEFDEEGNADYQAINREVERLLFQTHVKQFRAKPEEIKCIPTEKQNFKSAIALKVMYEGRLDKNFPQSGNTFSHVMNASATAMERLLLECKLRGPCWIDIANSKKNENHFSHCELEYTVNMRNMKNITTAFIKTPSPFIKIMALNIVSMPSTDPKAAKDHEIVLISVLLRSKGLLDRVNYADQRAYERYCYLCPPKKGNAAALETAIKQSRFGNANVFVKPNERTLLSFFLAQMKNIDCDIVVAHDSHAQLSLLVSRIEKFGLKTWSFISRLKRTTPPSQSLSRTKTGQWELMAGRSVLCSKTASEELFPTKSYDLGDLVALLLPKEQRSGLTMAEIIEPFTSVLPLNSLTKLINYSWFESYYSLRIVFQLNALPLFVQITQIVGGVLSRTLLGGRSERNEYLLLHAFHEAGYVPPDKYRHMKADNAEKEKSKKAQYTGGLVLEPKKGFYDTYIVLLDFNSLYPSIIQEFNICHTTIDSCCNSPDENGLPEPPGATVEEGILPKEIGNLVQNRREVRSLMKNIKPGTDEYMKLDVRQKGLKLTANSMYGCLGFEMSRFCAKTLAAMVTSKGRELLTRTKEIVEKRGYAVVYGDTDSIMVNTNANNFNEARRLADDLKRIVNGGYTHIEMGIDGLFKRLLLLKKKKYAALTVSLANEKDVKRELKGLDIVRRDWSSLAREVGERVVDLILYSTERDELVNEVVKCLQMIAEEMKQSKVPEAKFEIYKQLTKNPQEYADAKTQPHVSVALRLNATGNYHFRASDVVKYIICTDGTNNSATQRAYHISELNKEKQIDMHYYLSQQIHPVVMRLCEPFMELDASRIAESLGLDPAGFRSRAGYSHDDGFDFTITKSVDYEAYDGFKFECPSCNKLVVIRSAVQGQSLNVYYSLESCPECHSDLIVHSDKLQSKLRTQLNEQISKFATTPYVCEDATCGFQSSDFSDLIWINSQGPQCPQCKSSVMKKDFSLKDLFYQQKFLREIFNYEYAITRCSDGQRQELKKREKGMGNVYDGMEIIVNSYLKNNSYNRVSLNRLFGGLGLTL